MQGISVCWFYILQLEFRKMVTITLYARQQKRHRCIEESFGLCGRRRGRGWDYLGKWHWNVYNIMQETNCQFRFNAWYWMLGDGALGWPRGMDEEGGGRAFRMGNTCIPVADSCWCMAKPIQYCKVKKKKKEILSPLCKNQIGNTIEDLTMYSFHSVAKCLS